MKQSEAGAGASHSTLLPAQQGQPAMLQKLLDSSLDVICSISADGQFLSVSAAAKNVWGYYPHELQGTSSLNLVADFDKQRTIEVAQAIMSGINTTNFENHYICKDGTLKPILWSITWDAEDKIMYAVAKDATALKLAAAKEKEHQKRLSRAFLLAHIAWWELDIATKVYTCSDEMYQLFDMPVPPDNKTTLESFLPYVHPDDKALVQQDFLCMCTQSSFQYEHRIIKPNGEVAYLMHYSELVQNEAGEPTTFLGATRNITDTRLHELQLKESEQKLQQYTQQLSDILESIGDGFYAVDNHWNVTYWNKKAEELLRRPRTQILGKNLWKEYAEAVPLKFHSAFMNAVNEKKAVQFEEYFPPLQIWVEVNAYPTSDGLSVFFKDITARIEQERNLKISNERFEFVSKATTDAIWDWDVVHNTNYFNEAFTHVFGHNRKPQTLTDSWADHLHTNDKLKVIKSIDAALANPAITGWESEYRFIKADGTIANVYDRALIIRNDEGKAIRMVGAMQDITKMKETEKAISKAIITTQEKERSEIGKELHDNVNQILTTVKLYIENIRDYPDHRMHFIEKSVMLAQRAINEIRMLSKQLVTPVMADLGFEATLSELTDHYKSLSLFNITLQFEANEAAIDKNMQLTIYRIVQEQLNNIVKYAHAKEVKIKVVQQPNTLLVQVTDDGVGFDTTQTSGGLGLRNIEHRSQLFKGQLKLQSAPGSGCHLQIIFPLS